MLNKADTVDRYINKMGEISEMSPWPAGVVVSVDVVDSFNRLKKISTKWLPEWHHVLQSVKHSVCCWQLDSVEDNINRLIIGTWLNSVNGVRYSRPQNWAWASSQWGTSNIWTWTVTNEKKKRWNVGVTITIEKDELLQCENVAPSPPPHYLSLLTISLLSRPVIN